VKDEPPDRYCGPFGSREPTRVEEGLLRYATSLEVMTRADIHFYLQ